MKAKILLYIIIVLHIALGVSLFFNYKQYRDAKEPVKVERKVEVSSKETTSVKPAAASETAIGYVSVPIKKKVPKEPDAMLEEPCSSDTLPVVGDSLFIPITQKVYSDSLYIAYVSGYQQRLDSIKVRTFTVHETVTMTKQVPTFRRWNVGLIAGYGYGFKNKQLEPFVGVGVTVSLFK